MISEMKFSLLIHRKPALSLLTAFDQGNRSVCFLCNHRELKQSLFRTTVPVMAVLLNISYISDSLLGTLHIYIFRKTLQNSILLPILQKKIGI